MHHIHCAPTEIMLKKTIEKDHVRVIPSLETIITILKENNTHITSNSQK